MGGGLIWGGGESRGSPRRCPSRSVPGLSIVLYGEDVGLPGLPIGLYGEGAGLPGLPIGLYGEDTIARSTHWVVWRVCWAARSTHWVVWGGCLGCQVYPLCCMGRMLGCQVYPLGCMGRMLGCQVCPLGCIGRMLGCQVCPLGWMGRMLGCQVYPLGCIGRMLGCQVCPLGWMGRMLGCTGEPLRLCPTAPNPTAPPCPPGANGTSNPPCAPGAPRGEAPPPVAALPSGSFDLGWGGSRGSPRRCPSRSVKLVKWSSQGMLRMSAEAMNELFQPTVKCIVQHIESLLQRPEVRGVKFLFLVGGFADSPVLQRSVRAALGSRCRLLVPHDAALSTLKGAVLFGLDPGTVRVRRSPLTFGVGVLNKFIDGKHPEHKLLLKDGRRWCSDVFDKFVAAEQSVALGEVVQRSYCPARTGQRRTVIDIYCCDRDDVTFVTEPGVTKCGTVSLELPELPGGDGGRREIRAAMQFGDTEIKVTAVDVSSARTVRATIDFLTP
uniref:Heat shock 70 kDa protein 12B-like n=1 Tax=Coturnix japonica TaxID=93934 RepID=A0A8C2ST99_COTJA